MPNRPSLPSATMHGLARSRRRRRHVQHRRERRQRNVLAIDFGHRALLELADVAGAHLKNAADGGGRQREQLLAGLEQHDTQQRERQRKVQRDARALVELRLDAHGAAKPLDHALDDVHADAASRDVGGQRARAETGLEDHVEKLLGRPAIDIARGGHTALDGDGAQHRQIDAAPVVFQRNQNAIALLLGRQDQMSGGRLADAHRDRPASRCRDRRRCE